MYDDEESMFEDGSKTNKNRGCIFISLAIMVTLIICGVIAKKYIVNPLGEAFAPKEKFVKNSISPKGNYKIQVYSIENGDKTNWAVDCYLIAEDNEEKVLIFSDNKVKEAIIEWIDNDTVNINNHKLSLPDGRYNGLKE